MPLKTMRRRCLRYYISFYQKHLWGEHQVQDTGPRRVMDDLTLTLDLDLSGGAQDAFGEEDSDEVLQ